MESALRGGFGGPGMIPEGLRLIETALWDGTACPRIEGHLARLAAGAAALGWDCDPARVRDALTGPAGAPLRLRLTLAADGAVEVTRADLPPALPLWRLGPAAQVLSSADPWLRIKSTERAHYDAARAGMAADFDELVFRNERDEVCDGTITTLFFDRGEGMRTPPLASGLLPGVLRAELLGQGMCREEVLSVGDLPRVRLWIGNALRGLIPAEWRG